MARTTGTRSLGDLIKAGKLKPGEKLIVRRRSAPPIEGRLNADGSISVKGRSFTTPSSAAREALDVGSVDGWLRWRVPRLDLRTLADLRDQK
jgi:hypothetical protein